MTKVRAKFRCTSVTKQESWNKEIPFMYTVKMQPVYGNGDPNHENTKFWNATPSGSLELGCINETIQWEVGKEYYLDITLAE